jgi:pimeloyl-ACP methyl ester carboxylesterase
MNIVLLHGLTGSKRYFVDLETKLKILPNASILSFDLLGFGTDYKNTSSSFSLKEHLAHITNQIQKRFGNESIALIGHSLGGVLALAWAAEHKNQVEKIILLNTPLAQTSEDAQTSIMEVPRKFLNWSYLILRHRFFSFLACNILCRLNGMKFFESLKPAYISHEVFEDYRRHSWKSLTKTLEQVFLAIPARAVLAQITHIPVLIISGNQDSEIMRRHPTQPNVTHSELKGGHQIALENPDQTLKAISTFLFR